MYAQESLTHERSVLPDVTPFCLSGKSFKREREREALASAFRRALPEGSLAAAVTAVFAALAAESGAAQ